MEFDNLDSRPGKSWNFGLDSRSWKVMEFDVGKCVCSRAAYCSGLSDMYAGKHIKLRQDVNLFRTLLKVSTIPYSETQI